MLKYLKKKIDGKKISDKLNDFFNLELKLEKALHSFYSIKEEIDDPKTILSDSLIQNYRENLNSYNKIIDSLYSEIYLTDDGSLLDELFNLINSKVNKLDYFNDKNFNKEELSYDLSRHLISGNDIEITQNYTRDELKTIFFNMYGFSIDKFSYLLLKHFCDFFEVFEKDSNPNLYLFISFLKIYSSYSQIEEQKKCELKPEEWLQNQGELDIVLSLIETKKLISKTKDKILGQKMLIEKLNGSKKLNLLNNKFDWVLLKREERALNLSIKCESILKKNLMFDIAESDFSNISDNLLTIQNEFLFRDYIRLNNIKAFNLKNK